jgi:zinc and cadmium transporter
MPVVLLTYYCALILLASLIGGMIPVWFRLTHQRMQIAVSFVAGVMLGVALLHMLPHAVAPATASASAGNPHAVTETMIWLLAGVLVMFFMERFFCFHHHDVPAGSSLIEPTPGEAGCGHSGHDPSQHDHSLSWSGAAFGLTLHSIINGVALAAAVEHGGDGAKWAGVGTFLVVFLHKPFDAMTIGTLMARGGWSLGWRHAMNALFSLAIPLGAFLFHFGLAANVSASGPWSIPDIVADALAFSAGTFLCISLSDLLPELQFHHHDRVKLSLALVAGLAVAYAAARFEAAFADHSHGAPAAISAEAGRLG